MLRTVVRTKKCMEESSQRAHATFDNGADPSGPDRGLNQVSRRRALLVDVGTENARDTQRVPNLTAGPFTQVSLGILSDQSPSCDL